MKVTAMHFAFLTSNSVNGRTPLGVMILETARAHHEQMKRDIVEKQVALAKQRERLSKSLDAC